MSAPTNLSANITADVTADDPRDAAPKVAVVRDSADRVILFVDSSIGFMRVVNIIGPKYQQTVLRGGATTIWVDYVGMRFQIGPIFLKETLRGTCFQHIMDLPQHAGDKIEHEDDTFDYEDDTFGYEGEGEDQVPPLTIDPRALDMEMVPAKSTPTVKTTTRKRSVARIPRPRNVWLLYRSEKSKQIHQSRPNMSAGAISTEVSRMWKEEPDEVKAYYASLADEEARQHKIKYPEYRYQPSGTKRRAM